MSIKTLLRPLFCAALAASAGSQAFAVAYQPVYLSFSGGNNVAPLVITVGSGASFLLTTNTGYHSFAIDELGDAVTKFLVSSSITYTVNGGTPLTIDKLSADGYDINDITPLDALFSSSEAGALSNGDLVNFLAGTATTDSIFYYAPPANGYYNLSLVSSNGVIVAQAVPEPASCAALLGGAVLAGVALRRRRRA